MKGNKLQKELTESTNAIVIFKSAWSQQIRHFNMWKIEFIIIDSNAQNSSKIKKELLMNMIKKLQ